MTITAEPSISSLPAARVLLLPGWQNSGPDHWQSHWERLHGDLRVEQDDWLWPRRGDWMTRLEETLLSLPAGVPAVLVAHSLGCHLVSAWSAHSSHTARVATAFLVAPPDVLREDLPPQLAPWRTVPCERLPFPSRVVFSSDDPYCDPERARRMAAAWGSEVIPAGPLGHLNGDSKLGEWPEGRSWFESLAGHPR
jgi:predicted alpha/beta hydrolase family esterase